MGNRSSAGNLNGPQGLPANRPAGRRGGRAGRVATAAGLAATLGVAMAGGCGAGADRAAEGSGDFRTVRPEAFAERPAGPAPAASPVVVVEPSPEPARTFAGSGAFGAEPVVVRGSNRADAAGSTGATDGAPTPAAPMDELALVEAKVGDINGKPIYISSFFEPIEARLIAEAQRLNRAEWLRLARDEIILQRLDGIIADELLRAEALASLTPAQRQGLRAFVGGFRRDLLTQNLGSEQLARRRLESGTGQTLDEALRAKETDTLIQLSLFQQINRRVNVSWRDIQQRYERDAGVYNPAPVARFRLIRVPTDSAEAVERITQRLASGEAFEAVAADPANTFRASDAGLVEASFEGPFEAGEFFGAADLNQRARGLETGAVEGPFELGSSTAWLMLDGIERTSISLYEAQLRINQELTRERRRQEQRAYLNRLIERARVGNREEMLGRLMRIAEERYGPDR